MEIINVLWTGGLDSTYLIIKLCKYENIVIKPYYIIDNSRGSVEKELSAIRNIRRAILSDPSFRAILEETILIKKDEIVTNQSISQSWKNLNESYKLGSQYDFLSRFANQYNLKLAVGVLFSDRGKVARTIEGSANTQLVKSSINGIQFLEIRSSEETDTHRVFENLLFPLFMKNIEKVDEWEELKSMGYEHIAHMTWFCHHPVLGLPCGRCNPCQDALNEGMSFRVPLIGRILGYVLIPFSKIINRLKRLVTCL